MKRLKHFSILFVAVLALLLLITPKAEAATVASGTCGANGDNLTWILDDQGTLTISGTGAMQDYEWNRRPWSYSITSVIIENGVTNIGDYAFYSSSALHSVSIGNGVVDIGDYAFMQCTKLTTIEIPDGVTTIGTGAFANCKSLETISVPDSVLNIGDSAFHQTAWYDNQPDGLVYIGKIAYRYKGSSCPEIVEIREGTVVIAPRAFMHRYTLRTVVIPDSVMTIGDEAFSNAGITTIDLSENLVFIGSQAFCSTNLTTIKLPDKLTTIGQYAFGGSKLTGVLTIPDGVTIIDDSAFSSCSGLVSVIIGCNVEFIGQSAFFCQNLKTITFTGSVPNGEKWFDGGSSQVYALAFYPENDSSWENAEKKILGGGILWLPNTIDHLVAGGSCGDAAYWSLDDQGNMRIFGNGTLAWTDEYDKPWKDLADQIKTLTIEEGVTAIKAKAFNNCSEMIQLSIGPDVQMIGNSAFYNCTGLTKIYFNAANMNDCAAGSYIFCYAGQSGTGIEVVIGKDVTRVPAWLFNPQGDNNFNSTRIPYITSVEFEENSNCKTIGKYAFGYCREMLSLNMPDSITVVEGYAFVVCSKLEAVYITDLSAWCGIDFGEYESNPLSYAKKLYLNGQLVTEVILEAQVEKIGSNVFTDYPHLKRVEIKGSVPKISNGAFQNCKALESFSIRGSAASIGDYAFYNCSNLTEVTIPEGVITIGNFAFSGCTNLMSVTIPKGVTTIGDDAFWGCAALTSITIPEGATTIGNTAFTNCSSLITIDIPDSVSGIGYYAFHHTAWYDGHPDGLLYAGKVAYTYKGECPENVLIQEGTLGVAGSAFENCTNLKTINIPDSVCVIGDSAFYGCTGLSTINIPDGVTVIDAHVFSGCTSLETINIPDKVTTIGYGAFYNCTNLKTINIPDEVVTIQPDAFYCCRALTGELILPNKLTDIGYSAFNYCSGFTSVTIPDGVTKIGVYAFSGCTGLKSVTIGYSVVEMGVGAFGYCPGLETIYFKSVNIDDLSNTTSVFIYSGTRADGIKVIIGNKVERVPSYLFGGFDSSYTYPNVTSIEFESGSCCKSIGTFAFMGCLNLKEVLFRDSAPSFESNVFNNVTATAYYPADDPTWTEDVRQNYGGTITWVGYESITEGTCGEGVYWSYDEETRTLTIYTQQATRSAVQGTMTSAPWKLLYGDQIKAVVIEEGVQNIVADAFEGCDNLETVTIAKTVTEIGGNAFANCPKLTAATFEGSAPKVDTTAFAGTTTTVYYPQNDTTWSEEIKGSIGDANTFVPVAPPVLYGDVNGDGKINGTDISLTRRYIAGGYDVTIIEAAADVNGDGKINGTDISLIRRYIAGGYGVELNP